MKQGLQIDSKYYILKSRYKQVKYIFKVSLFFYSMIFISCGIDEALKQEYLNEGIWRGIIKTQGQEIPFNFEVIREDSVTYDLNIINGAERLNIKGLAMQGDSVFIRIYIFDAEIKAKLIGNKLIGFYQKNYDEKSKLPFEATHNNAFRFPSKNASKSNVDGKWEVTFTENEKKVDAIGIFKQDGEKVEGTFLTSSGDFRFLDGNIQENTLWLSSFDGANAFLFKADITNSNEMNGHFWSGAFHYQTWQGRKNESAILPEVITEDFITEGNKIFSFNLTDLNGKWVSLSDPKYSNRVKVIHMFGTWSSNCIDEVRFLTEWHKQNKDLDVVVIGLAFEQKDDFTYAKLRVNKMMNKLNSQYEFLIAGTADKVEAAKKFPVLKSIENFPTTIILDKQNTIRKIYTGFRGPGSGAYHKEYIEEFNDTIKGLLMEGQEVGLLLTNN